MTTMASQITSLTVVYSTVYSDADQRKHQSSASLAFVWGNSPHKGPVTRKMFPFDDVIMIWYVNDTKQKYSLDYYHEAMSVHQNFIHQSNWWLSCAPHILRRSRLWVSFVCWHVEVSDIYTYRQTSNISCSKYQNLNGSHLVVVFAQSIDAGCEVENEDVRAVPTSTSEWSTILLSGVPDYFYRNKISSGGDLSHYSSASLY